MCSTKYINIALMGVGENFKSTKKLLVTLIHNIVCTSYKLLPF